MQPTYFINHGGGPCFFLKPGPMFAGALSEPPRALLVVSVTGSGSARPTMPAWRHRCCSTTAVFPTTPIELTWPAPGSPGLAARVHGLLGAAGLDSAAETACGWDHGVFVPMKVMFPAADLPVVQLSLQHGLDPQVHLAVGRALKPLRDEGVLIIGSGQTYHNLRGFMSGRGQSDPAAEAFHGHVLGKPVSGFRFG